MDKDTPPEKVRLVERLHSAGLWDDPMRAEIAALWKYGLARIANFTLRHAVTGFLGIVPLRFYTDPASKSGTMHPPWQNGRHGTLRSIVESCVILPDVAKHIPEIVDDRFVPYQSALDRAFAATIISDVWKKEDEGDVHHGPMHGHVAAKHWRAYATAHAPALALTMVEDVAVASELHYGVFAPGWKVGDLLPPIARLVNLCDVFTSLPSLKIVYEGKTTIA